MSNLEQSAIHKEVIKACQTEYESMREVLRDDARIIIDKGIKDAFENLENSIKENTRQLIEENHQELLKELQAHIQPLENLLQEGDQTPQPQTGDVMEYEQAKNPPSDKSSEKLLDRLFHFLQLQKRPVMLILAAAFLAYMSIVIYVTFFSDMSPEKEPVQVSEKQNNKTIPKNKETTQAQDQPSSSDKSSKPLPSVQETQSVADLKKEDETYAEALIRIVKTPSAPEHLKLKELIKKISTADGLKNTTNSIISESQKNKFAKFEFSDNNWKIFYELAVGAVEYIAAIKCNFTVCNIKIDLEIEDLTDEILTDLNQSLPESDHFDPVPQKYKDNKKASGFTEEFKEFMAAVVLAHIMQKDENP